MEWIERIPDAAFSWWWAAWLAVGFGVPEAVAIVRKRPGDTLSEHVWRVFGIRGYTVSRGVKWRRFGLLAFLAWLVGHFLTGGFF